VRRLLQETSERLLERGCTPVLVEDTTIVLAEVLNNVEEHAYGGRAGEPVTIEIDLSEGGVFCRVEDRGTALPEHRLPGAIMPSADPDVPGSWPEGGFGWPLVRRLACDLGYERREGRNRLRFRVPPRD
jgi:serine/threonine-protein kinase RsbW